MQNTKAQRNRYAWVTCIIVHLSIFLWMGLLVVSNILLSPVVPQLIISCLWFSHVVRDVFSMVNCCGWIGRSRINEYFQFPLQRTLFYSLTNMRHTVSHSQQYDSVSRVLVKLFFTNMTSDKWLLSIALFPLILSETEHISPIFKGCLD